MLHNPHPEAVVNIHDLVTPLTAAVVNAVSLYPRSVLFDIFGVAATTGRVRGQLQGQGGRAQEDKNIIPGQRRKIRDWFILYSFHGLFIP